MVVSDTGFEPNWSGRPAAAAQMAFSPNLLLPRRVRWASRTLSGLAAAAQRGEDCYGVVLLCDPNLADMVAALAALALALQAYSKHLVRVPPGMIRWDNAGQPEACAFPALLVS